MLRFAALGFCLCFGLQAATLKTYTVIDSESGPFPLNSEITLTLPLFNPTLGQLTYQIGQSTASFEAEFRVTNNSDEFVSGTVDFLSGGIVSAPLFVAPLGWAEQGTSLVELDAMDSMILTGGFNIELTTLTDDSQFIGPGQTTLTLFVNPIYLSQDFDVELIGITSGLFGAQIEYTYLAAETPEPSTFGLAFAGVLALVAAYRRTKTSKHT